MSLHGVRCVRRRFEGRDLALNAAKDYAEAQRSAAQRELAAG